MTTTIADVFDLPRPEDVRAMGFVIRLQDAEAEACHLVEEYVVTPAVERELPRIFDVMKQIHDRGEEYGRFVRGSFGSGKPHFLSLLSLLLEGSRLAWEKLRPYFDAHRSAQARRGREASDAEAWVAEAGLLVVRLHMISVRGRTTGLDRAVYDAFNRSLARHGKAPFEFRNVDALFEEVRREARRYGDVVWKHLEDAGIVGGHEDFEALAKGSLKARERFARHWLEYKGRDVGQAGVDPNWTEGLKRMGAHAREQGFGGIVLMIDELLLWLGEKETEEFIREINNLVAIMDHDAGQRPLPIYVFVALQRDIKDFFPERVEESRIHEEIDHHAKRFETTRLEDVELRHIVKGRVLKVRDAAAVGRAVDGLASQHQKLLPALLAGGDFDYLRDVYPFHPALIEMLVDVTTLMQRERSALRLLYKLLMAHPELPLGELLPVGSAFGFLFPEAGVEASKKVELMQDIHHQYYRRLRPTMVQMLGDEDLELDAERHRALDQVVRTVLLAEVSPRWCATCWAR